LPAETKPKPSILFRLLCALPLALVLCSIGIGIGWFVHPGLGLATAGAVLWFDSLIMWRRQ